MIRVDVRGLDGRELAGALEPVARHLEADGLIGYPTSTVYGFGGGVSDRATRRLGELKGRDPERPFLLLVPDDDPLDGLGWTEGARALAEAFWPGPLTLVLKGGAELPNPLRNRRGGVAVRRSDHPVVRALLRIVEHPITSTSANAPGAAPATDAEQCAEAWTALGGGATTGAGMVVDGGPLTPSAPSTIVDCLDEVPRVRREGALAVSLLRSVVPQLLASPLRP